MRQPTGDDLYKTIGRLFMSIELLEQEAREKDVLVAQQGQLIEKLKIPTATINGAEIAERKKADAAKNN